LEEEGQWEDHETDGKMSYRGMQPTCSEFGTGRVQQEIRRSRGRRFGRPWHENGPKRHRRRRVVHDEKEYRYKCGAHRFLRPINF
jgi:hypothetical protein